MRDGDYDQNLAVHSVDELVRKLLDSDGSETRHDLGKTVRAGE